MNYDYSKRDYLLPEGCKDLIDVQKLEAQKKALEQERTPKPPVPRPLPPIVGEVVIPAQTTVLQLASILTQKPFQIIADLMEIGVFATVNQELDFDTIAKVTRRHGYTAKNAA
jgi:translation initiation factor IF-2